MEFTNTQPIVLASASPRRRELLEGLGIEFTVQPSTKDEPAPENFHTAMGYVIECALAKAKDVAKGHPDAVVIGSDTVVVLDGDILLKPRNKEEARTFLGRLSGRTHDVITAVSIIKGGSVQSFHEIVRVTFHDVPNDWIEAYTATRDPYDKAGAYGIQTASALFVKAIEGDYNAVVGLPISALAQKLVLSGYMKLQESRVEC